MYFDVASKAIGNTPLVRLFGMEKCEELKGALFVKIEGQNPAGSVKDRAAAFMIEEAEKNKKLVPGGVIVEPTSGNTGIGLAFVGISRGYKVILCMPDSMSEERRKLLSAYGAQLVLTDGAKGMKGAIEKSKEIVKETQNSYMPSQFDNPANALAHEKTTGPEIWHDSNGKVDVLVAGVGTGGTITGTGRYLKSQNPHIHVVAVEPAESPVLSGGSASPHKIQGIGAGFVPGVLDTSIYDEVVTVSAENAYATTKLLAEKEGILAGISSGAALWAGIQLCKKDEYAGKNVTVILPDSGERYLSTGVFD